MSRYRLLGEGVVASTELRLDKFSADLARVQTAVVAAARDGRIDKEAAGQAYLDREHALSMPLQARYLAEGALDQVVEHHRRTNRIRLPGWPDALARAALDGLLARARADLAVALARLHLEQLLKTLLKDAAHRRRRGPRKPMEPGRRAAIEALQAAIVADLPKRKVELLADLEAVTTLIERHGSEEDKAWLVGLRAQVWQERRA